MLLDAIYDRLAVSAGAGALPLVLVASATLLFALVFARFGPPRKSNHSMTLTVKWGRDKLRVPLPEPDATLGTLRHLLADQTGLPPASFKLVHAGAIMKDDNAPLSAYGLRSGSKIVIIDGAANPITAGPPSEGIKEKSQPATEEGTISAIHDELALVKDRFVPALDYFLLFISPPQTAPTSSAPDAAPTTVSPPSSTESAPASQPSIPTEPPPNSFLPDIEMEHRRIGEELLQSLLRLDLLNLDGNWLTARAERKGAVKAVQALLDRLDGGWRERKERLASGQAQAQ